MFTSTKAFSTSLVALEKLKNFFQKFEMKENVFRKKNVSIVRPYAQNRLESDKHMFLLEL